MNRRGHHDRPIPLNRISGMMPNAMRNCLLVRNPYATRVTRKPIRGDTLPIYKAVLTPLANQVGIIGRRAEMLSM